MCESRPINYPKLSDNIEELLEKHRFKSKSSKKWVIKESRKNNKSYWFNMKTGESQWTNPFLSEGIAALFLTYDNIYGFMDKCLENMNIYIHPKYPDKVDNKYRRYIIKDIIETSWGDMSIVRATINLLKSALSNKENKWFVLLSGDTSPTYHTSEELFYFLARSNGRSFFDVNPNYSNKTSQWWILNRKDAETIVNSEIIKLDIEKTDGAPDEFYFLTLLKKKDPEYEFNNFKSTYTEWLPNVTTKHPVTFNKLLINDIDSIRNYGSFFIRKTLEGFNFNSEDSIYGSLQSQVFVLTIGSETNQSELISKIGLFQKAGFFILALIPVGEINKEITRRCIKIYSVIYGLLGASEDSLRSILNITTYILPEKFDYSKITSKENIDVNEITTIMGTIKAEKKPLPKFVRRTPAATGVPVPTPAPTQPVKIEDSSNINININPEVSTKKKEKPLKFVHITKCGGTTIENIGKENNIDWGRFDEEYKKALLASKERMKKDWWHTPPRYFEADYLKKILEDNDFFTVVRNPYERVVSEYYDNIGGPEVKSEDVKKFNKSIEAYLKNMQDKMKDISSPLCCHHVPQYLYIYDKNGNKIVKNIIKLENMNKEFNELMTKYGYNFKLDKDKKENIGKKHFGVKDISPKNIELINELYNEDFNNFGYSKINVSSDKKKGGRGQRVGSFSVNKRAKKSRKLIKKQNKKRLTRKNRKTRK